MRATLQLSSSEQISDWANPFSMTVALVLNILFYTISAKLLKSKQAKTSKTSHDLWVKNRAL
jgi:hypothetical protein